MASCFFQRQGIYETSSQWQYILLLYPLTFTQLNRECNWLILGHMALTRIKCITIVIHYSKSSNHGGTGGKWRDRRREKHCQFSFSRMNTTVDKQEASSSPLKFAEKIMRGLFLYYCPLIWTVKPCNFSGAILQHNCRVCLFTRVWDGMEGWTGDYRSSHL